MDFYVDVCKNKSGVLQHVKERIAETDRTINGKRDSGYLEETGSYLMFRELRIMLTVPLSKVD